MSTSQATPVRSHQKLCQYVDPETGKACNKFLQGHGRHKWCEEHGPFVRAEKKNNATNVQRFRERHPTLVQVRRFIDQQVNKVLNNYRGSAALNEFLADKRVLTHRYKMYFGDTDAPLTIMHALIRGYHTYIVADGITYEVLGLLFSKEEQPVPGCSELEPDSPAWELLKSRLRSRECPDCGELDVTPFFGFVLLPHPPDEHYAGRFRTLSPAINPAWFSWIRSQQDMAKTHKLLIEALKLIDDDLKLEVIPELYEDGTLTEEEVCLIMANHPTVKPILK